jgi:hypothetical protein
MATTTRCLTTVLRLFVDSDTEWTVKMSNNKQNVNLFNLLTNLYYLCYLT